MSSRKQKYDEIVDEVLGAGVSTVTKNTYEKGTSREKTNKEELDNVVEPISVEQNNEIESNLSGELHESVVEQVSKDNTASEILEEKSEEIVAPVEEEFETESKDEELANEVEQQSNDESQSSVSGISAEELAAAMAEMPKKEEPQVKTTTSGGTVSAISAEELAAAMGDMPKAPDIIIEKSEPKHDEVVTPVTQEKVEQVVETPQTELVEDEPMTELVEDEPMTELVEDEPMTELVEDEPMTELVEDEPMTELVEDESMTELVEDEPMTELVEDENEEYDEEYSSPTEKMTWADFFGELKGNSLTPAEKEEVNSRKKILEEKKIAEEEKPIINQEIDDQQSVEVNEKPISSQESVASEQQLSVDNETISQEKLDDAAHKDLLNKLSSKPVDVKTTEGGGTVSGISAEELAAAMGIVYTPDKAPVVDNKIEESIEESEGTYFEEEEPANEEIIDEENESEVEPLHNESEDFDAQETETVEGSEVEDYIAEEIEEILNDGVEEESEEELVDGEEADFAEEPEDVFEDETTPIKKEITAEELEKQKRDEEQLAKLDEATRREYEMLVRKYSHNPIADKNKVDIIVKGDYDAEFDFEKRTDIKKISKAGKKKPFIIVAAILAVLLAVFLPVYFLVLNKEYEEPVVLTNVVFEAGANYYIYQDVGEYIDLSSAYMTATYSDGTTKKIQCDLSNLSYKDSWIEQTDEGLLIPDNTTALDTTLRFKYGQFENPMTIKIRHYTLDSINVIAYNIGNVVAGDKIAYSNFVLSKVLKQTSWTTDPAPIQTREQIMKESDYNQINLSITKDGADFLTCTWEAVVADGGITFTDAGEYKLTFIYSGKPIAVNITVTA